MKLNRLGAQRRDQTMFDRNSVLSFVRDAVFQFCKTLQHWKTASEKNKQETRTASENRTELDTAAKYKHGIIEAQSLI